MSPSRVLRARTTLPAKACPVTELTGLDLAQTGLHSSASWPGRGPGMGDASRYLATCHLTPPLGGDPVGVEAVWAAFSPRGLAPGQRHCAAGEPVWADPPDASSALVNAVRGKIVFIVRGNVDWTTKAQHAEQAGATGVIFINSEDALDPLPVAGGDDQARIPCVMVRKNALSDKRLTQRSFGRGAVPSHANPDGPSFCTITCATMGEVGARAAA